MMGTKSTGTPVPGPFSKEQDRIAVGGCWGCPSPGVPGARQCRVLGIAVSPRRKGVAALPGRAGESWWWGRAQEGWMERDGEEEKRWGDGEMEG